MYCRTDPAKRGEYFLVVEPGTRCFAGAHLTALPFLVVIGAGYLIGFPIAALIVAERLYERVASASTLSLQSFSDKYGFLFRGVKDGYYWLRPIQFFTSLVFAAESVFLDDPDVKIFSAGTNFIVNFALVGIFLPFVQSWQNGVALASGVAAYGQILLFLYTFDNRLWFWLACGLQATSLLCVAIYNAIRYRQNIQLAGLMVASVCASASSSIRHRIDNMRTHLLAERRKAILANRAELLLNNQYRTSLIKVTSNLQLVLGDDPLPPLSSDSAVHLEAAVVALVATQALAGGKSSSASATLDLASSALESASSALESASSASTSTSTPTSTSTSTSTSALISASALKMDVSSEETASTVHDALTFSVSRLGLPQVVASQARRTVAAAGIKTLAALSQWSRHELQEIGIKGELARQLDDAIQLLEACLELDPARRVTAADALDLPFLANVEAPPLPPD